MSNPIKTKSILQIMVACYVIYLSYGLKDGIIDATGGKKAIFLIAAVFMTLASLFIIIRALRIIIKKEYEIEESDSNSSLNEEMTKENENDEK